MDLAQGSKYKVAFRRRREGKTNYGARIKLVDLDNYRLVVRLSNSYVTAQIIKYNDVGDETVVSAHSKELSNYGWLGGAKNTSAAYLTGYLVGKKAVSKGIDKAILDIGLRTSTKGSKLYAALKGANDAELYVPHNESILPEEDRISGQHIVDYANALDEDELKAKFSKYLERGLQPADLSNHFNDVKTKIDEAEV
jgi:large subunit ribosomal protein L18